MTDLDDAEGPEPAEHRRFARYVQELAVVRAEDEAHLVSLALRDPDEVMAQSAVAGHLDRRAAQMLIGDGFLDWARTMAMVIGEWEFLTRRLREWTLLRAISVKDPWEVEDLLAASDWFQRKAALTLTSSAALSVLATEGRTRRVRADAGRRLVR